MNNNVLLNGDYSPAGGTATIHVYLQAPNQSGWDDYTPTLNNGGWTMSIAKGSLGAGKVYNVKLSATINGKSVPDKLYKMNIANN